MSNAPDLSIVLSFFNEAENIPPMIERIQKALEPTGLTHEILFVNDASTDDSEKILAEQNAKDPRVKCLTMSRAFGYEECFLAGMQYSKGRAVVTLDADLQDPPELIPEMVEEWKKGADIVHTTRTKREGEPAFKMLITKIGYRVIRLFSNINIPVDTGMYKLMSRRAVEALLKLGEKEPYVRGQVAWIGFKQAHVYYQRHARFAGETHASLLSIGSRRSLLTGVTSFSFLLITLTLLAGFLVFAAGIVCGLFLLACCCGSCESGHSSLPVITVILLVGGLQILAVGFVGLYVRRIFTQVLNRPLYIVASTIGI